MNKNCKRFLALNCVLHGMDLNNVFESVSDFADCLEIEENDAETLMTGLSNLLKVPDISKTEHPAVMSLLNFMRCEEYAFIAIPDNGVFTLFDVVVSDRKGEIDQDIVEAVLRQLIRDVSFVSNPKDVKVADGVLQILEEDKDRIAEFLLEAYRLYKEGPVVAGSKEYPNYLMSHRGLVSVIDYKGVAGSRLITVFKELIACGRNPSDFTRTTFSIPNYVEVFKATGCIFERNAVNRNTINWLLDVVDSDKCKVMIVDIEILRKLLVTSLHDLSTVKYKIGAANGGLYIGD